jgi:O-succinylbenzoic acid--CoA ligase
VAHLRGSDLVAVLEPPGPEWLAIVAEAWAAGAAVLALDHRLPASRVGDLIARAGPTAIVRDGAVARLGGGEPVGVGVGLVMATSGSSGPPKLAELSHEALAAALGASAARIGAERFDPWLCCLPVSHMGGMLVLARALVQGSPVEVHRGFDVERVTAAARAGVRFVSLVPTMLHRLLESGTDLAAFGAILIGGAALDPELRARAEAAGANVIHTYGSTETCGGVVYDGAPLDGVEIAIQAADRQILVRGPTLMRGFRLDPLATAAAFTPNGWLLTGDAGWLGPRGLQVRGRLDDAIVTGGEKVWPADVEAALRSHPGVADVLVAGAADVGWGQRVRAFVVAADPADPPSLADLRAHASRTVPGYALPRELTLVSEVPRTVGGKPIRADADGRRSDPRP